VSQNKNLYQTVKLLRTTILETSGHRSSKLMVPFDLQGKWPAGLII